MSHIRKCTLVPSRFFDEGSPRCILSQVALLSDEEEVRSEYLPEFDAYIVYAPDGSGVLPELYYLLKSIDSCPEYNRIFASYDGCCLHLAISRGRNLQLANVYEAADFTTAEYFIFAAMKALQLNPEISTIYWRHPLNDSSKMSLYRYFKSVEVL